LNVETASMQLKQLVATLKTVSVEGSLDREVAGIAYDSRRLTPGMVFVAIPGQRVNGQDFIQSAVDRGAVAVIYEGNGFVPLRAAKIKVTDAREALAQAAAAYYQHPGAILSLIGITGTNGKTTVSFMIKQILEAAGIKTGLIGTIRYQIGERIIPAQRTTPESLEIQQLLAQMLRAGCRACVMEVSSHALEQKRVWGVEFDVAIFTNLTQDHLDYHGTMDAYFSAKKKLFARRPNHRQPRVAVINIDDAYGVRLAKETEAEVVIQYGLERAAQFRATQIHLGSGWTQMQVQTPTETFGCRLPLIGRHNVYNALAAIGAGRALNIGAAHIQEALSGLPPVPGRVEKVELGQPFSVLVDFAHTDDALHNVLTALREITPGRLLLAFGCGGNRDTGKRPKMGKVAAQLADLTLITSDNPRKESAAAIASQIESGYRAMRTDGYRIELDRERAISELIGLAQPGDAVLIAGKGHETYQEFEDTVVPFDDRLHAQEILESMGYKPSD
jgi:UDP-N-acetylmuramoyl-L-alanyl-D-glutamate--2,6-diaminopimelate ligase